MKSASTTSASSTTGKAKITSKPAVSKPGTSNPAIPLKPAKAANTKPKLNLSDGARITARGPSVGSKSQSERGDKPAKLVRKPEASKENTAKPTKTMKTSDFLEQYGALSKKRRQKMVDEFGALIVREKPTIDLSAPSPVKFEDRYEAALASYLLLILSFEVAKHFAIC